jgi:adenylate cyclase, class 2
MPTAPRVTTRRNVELKAFDADPERSVAVCRALGATDQGVISQRDTYFNVPRGAMKLREESAGPPQLIRYQRSNQPQQRQSHYRIVTVCHANRLREVLAAALGVRAIVDKQRHLWLWKHVRIHLDDVKGLGRFIELEAVAPADSDLNTEHTLITRLREEFGITDDRLCAIGYAGLLVQPPTAST